MDEFLKKFFENDFDKEVLDWFFNNKSEFGVDFFEAISLLGDWKLLMPLILIIIAILLLKGKHKLVLPLLVSVLGTETAALFLKAYFDRARPILVSTDHLSSSFPSAHAAISIGFYAYLGYILLKFGNEKYKTLIGAIITLLIILIGFSRVYLTLHYPSDVVVGYMVGLLFFAIGVTITEKEIKEIEKEIEKEIKYLTEFYIGEFTIELSDINGQFDYEREYQGIAIGMNENFGFSRTEAKQIAGEVIDRLKKFAKKVIAAKEAAIQ